MNVERVLSSFGVSIGTGLALESLFEPTTERYDINREIPNKIDVNKYRYHYYNVFTLMRNIISSLVTKYSNVDEMFMDDSLLQVLIEELYVIESLYSGSKCEPILFIPDYTMLYKKMNVGKENTDSLVTKEYMVRSYVTGYIKRNKYKFPIRTIFGTYKLIPSIERCMILTHIPVDLLNVDKVSRLELLESNTGKIKGRSEWYSKYHKIGKNPMNIFPYIEELVYILGDGHIVLPMGLVTRRSLYQIASDSKWTSHTGHMKVVNDLNKVSAFKELLSKMKYAYK